MDARYIAFAVPFFLAMMAGELLINKRQGDARYRLHDAIANLSCGIGQQLWALLLGGVIIAAYLFVYEHWRLFDIPTTSIVAWVAVMLGVDFCYYLFHRASHRVNFLWAGHIVHHQSEEYNLSVALRQSWTSQFLGWGFYLPLALVGFPPLMFLVANTLNTLYQFWVHTRAVSRLGFAETFLNTPSHHRVHHGTNPKYIDRNYAGILIIWDKLCGTFQREEEEPTYGTVKPLASFNPLWANVQHWVQMGGVARRTSRIRDKLWIWFAPPEWFPQDLGGVATIPEVSRAEQQIYDIQASRGLDLYVAVNFVVALLGSTALLFLGGGLSIAKLVALCAIVLSGMTIWAGLLEAKKWAIPAEIARWMATVAVVAWLVAT